MRVKLYANAALNYVHRCYRHAHPQCGMLHRPEWQKLLEQVQGQWLEVETDYLFADQFNTAPIPGVSEQGLRVMAADVEEIEGDIRPGRYLDHWTNKNYAEIPEECKTGERRQHLYRFTVNPNKYARGVILIEKRVFADEKAA